jgi:hypothetical protein
MTRYIFEIQSLFNISIDDLGTNKESIRKDLIKNIEEGKYDKKFKKYIIVSQGRKEK